MYSKGFLGYSQLMCRIKKEGVANERKMIYESVQIVSHLKNVIKVR